MTNKDIIVKEKVIKASYGEVNLIKKYIITYKY